MHDLIYSTVAIQTYKTILLGHVCENHLPIHYQTFGESLHSSKYLYHLQFILIDFGIYKFPIKQNFCNIFLFHPPKQPATVHDKSFQAIYSLLSVSHYSSISSSTL